MSDGSGTPSFAIRFADLSNRSCAACMPPNPMAVTPILDHIGQNGGYFGLANTPPYVAESIEAQSASKEISHATPPLLVVFAFARDPCRVRPGAYGRNRRNRL